MSSIEYAPAPAALAGAAAPRQRRPVPPAVAHLLGLQAAAGNRAVTHLLGVPPATRRATVQRSEGGETTGEEGSESHPSEGAEGGVIGEALCSVMPDSWVVTQTKIYFHRFYHRAWQHLQHYLYGNGADYPEDVADLFRSNPRAGARVGRLIGSQNSGQLLDRTMSGAPIRQVDYDSEDWRLSIGGVDQIDFDVIEPAGADGVGTVRVTVTDPYSWHPQEDRGTQCLHQAMQNAQNDGARNYTSVGTAEVRLPLHS